MNPMPGIWTCLYPKTTHIVIFIGSFALGEILRIFHIKERKNKQGGRMKSAKIRKKPSLAALAVIGTGLTCWGVFAAPSVAHSSGIGIDTVVSSSTDVRSINFETELRYMTTSAAACGKTFKSTPPTGLSIVIW